MKNSKQNAERWLKEAESTLRQAKRNCEEKAYNLACFLAEQASQKALKAILYLDGARFINIHSVRELLSETLKRHGEFSEFIEAGMKLDQYYLSTRYPDAVPEPAIPSEIFAKSQAEEAVEIAGKIFEVCKKLVI